MSDDIGGFAIRREGNCQRLEDDCGKVQAPFRACCPQDTVCDRRNTTQNIYVRESSPSTKQTQSLFQC